MISFVLVGWEVYISALIGHVTHRCVNKDANDADSGHVKEAGEHEEDVGGSNGGGGRREVGEGVEQQADAAQVTAEGSSVVNGHCVIGRCNDLRHCQIPFAVRLELAYLDKIETNK